MSDRVDGVRRASFELGGRRYQLLLQADSLLSLRIHARDGWESLCTGRVKGGIVAWSGELTEDLSARAVAEVRKLQEAPAAAAEEAPPAPAAAPTETAAQAAPKKAAPRRGCSLCRKTDHTSRNCPKRNQKPKAARGAAAPPAPPPSSEPAPAPAPPPAPAAPPPAPGRILSAEEARGLQAKGTEAKRKRAERDKALAVALVRDEGATVAEAAAKVCRARWLVKEWCLEAGVTPRRGRPGPEKGTPQRGGVVPAAPLPEIGELSVPVLAFAVRQALRLLRGVSGPPSVAVAVDILTDALNFTQGTARRGTARDSIESAKLTTGEFNEP